HTKPETFADCIGNELPFGWEESYDPQIGTYYINHNTQTTQLEDPRLQWKSKQDEMLREYLCSAQDTLEAKKEILSVKTQRLYLAQEEYNHLNALAASRTSLCSSTSSCSTKFDPELLRADLAIAKERVFRLKKELSRIQKEMHSTQKGVDTLASVEQKLNAHVNGCYNISEAQAIMEEVKKIQKSLITGEREKKELMKSLAQVKDDLTRLQLRQESPDASTFNLAQDRICAASQTDLSSEHFPMGAREMAKMRQRYDEWRRRVKEIQEQLAALEEKIRPGELESDQDRLLLFQEKKQLLLEYRSITPKSRSPTEMRRIQSVCRQLEADLNMAYEESNQCIANRLKLHEEKQALLQQLLEALKEFTHLEHQLKSLSASTLSISSSSSLGSLSTASSKGSLSGLSFTDIYGDPLSAEPQIDMVDMNRRVQRLFHPSSEVSSLSPRSSLSTETPPASPMKLDWMTAAAAASAAGAAATTASSAAASASSNPSLPGSSCAVHAAINATAKMAVGATGACYAAAPPPSSSTSSSSAVPSYAVATGASPAPDYNLDRQRLEEQLQELKIRQLGLAGGPLSPIYEKPPYLEPAALLSRSSSTSNTRSVSTTVSDESVAGDSGVFEASRGPPALLARECAQVQIGLRYSTADSTLCITIERGSNLGALGPPAGCQLFVRAMLLPASAGPGLVRTGTVTDLVRPTFKTMLVVPLPLDKVYAKSLHVKVMVLIGQREDWIGSTQISLAEFNPADATTSRWYNIVSRKSMNESELLEGTGAAREESSDESTIISSQTSTLTRNQGQEELQAVLEMVYDVLSNDDDDDEEEEDEEEEDDEDEEDDEEELYKEAEEQQQQQQQQQPDGLKATASGMNRRRSKHLQRVVNSVEEEDEAEEHQKEEGCASAEATELMIQEYMNSVKEQCGGGARDGEDDGEGVAVVAQPSPAVQRVDKETNTECAFLPERSRRRFPDPNGPARSSTIEEGSVVDDRLVKRSQTFSPSAVASKARYICRLNRSDSDSAMHFNNQVTPHPFKRGSVERRSLRYHNRVSKIYHKMHPAVPRTSLDLELDLKAQQTKLETLTDEIGRLRELKHRLEQARDNNDVKVAAWALENEDFLRLVKTVNAVTPEERQLAKLLMKTSKEIYKLRKTKVGKGKLDSISFKEKMAFFTRRGVSVPELPTEIFPGSSSGSSSSHSAITTCPSVELPPPGSDRDGDECGGSRTPTNTTEPAPTGAGPSTVTMTSTGTCTDPEPAPNTSEASFSYNDVDRTYGVEV
uniref:Protein kibra n=1 Tax=Anopheles epiroticus TaxID=199890 RepID=A0A182P7M3_9DIPT